MLMHTEIVVLAGCHRMQKRLVENVHPNDKNKLQPVAVNDLCGGKLNIEQIRRASLSLESQGYLYTVKSDGVPVLLLLTFQGEHYVEYLIKKTAIHLMKWFASHIVEITALILSIVALANTAQPKPPS